jgi:hypothetical protein
MPLKDGSGPPRRGGGGGGGGRGSGSGFGPGGYCVCPGCGRKLPHERGVPCFQVKCPSCGMSMTRSQ